MFDLIDLGSTGLVTDGEAHGMPVTISHLSLVLGEPRRTPIADTHEEYAWDDVGVSARARAGTAFAEWFTVVTERGTAEWVQGPTSPFTGAITVDGVPLAEVPFRVGYKGGRYALVGPFLLLDVASPERGRRVEYSVAIPGFDYFPATTP